MRLSAAKAISAVLLYLLSITGNAQPGPLVEAREEGLRDSSPRVHALVGGRIVTAPGAVIERGTVVLRDGIIDAVTVGITPPPDARVWDVSEHTLYAGFIESQSTLFLPASHRRGGGDVASLKAIAASGVTPLPDDRSQNARVTPERAVARILTPDPQGAKELRALGFTVAHVIPPRGIFRGTSAVVALGDASFDTAMIRSAAAQHVAFEFGLNMPHPHPYSMPAPGWGPDYPMSLMGAIAIIRQTLFDAQWFAELQSAYATRHDGPVGRPAINASLAALAPAIRGELPVFLELRDELDVERAIRLVREFELRIVLGGTGAEYRVLSALAATRTPVVLPVDFPAPPAVETLVLARNVSLDELQHWELAPSNPARLQAAGVPIAITTARIARPFEEFWPNVRKAVRRGLAPAAALAALTTTPADMLGIGASHGTLEKGKGANVVVSRGDLFADDGAEVELVWIDGEPFELDNWEQFDWRGTWRLTWEGGEGPATMQVTGSTVQELQTEAEHRQIVTIVQTDEIVLLVPGELFDFEGGGIVRLSARGAGNELIGYGEMPDGAALRWSANRVGAPKLKPESQEAAADIKLLTRGDTFPAGAFGRKAHPGQAPWTIIRNTTLWTSTDAGVIEDGDMLIRHGKIVEVGRNLAAPNGATVVDATDRHVTPGLIDAHSHTAISGENHEGGNVVTAEVRIGDVIDATDIDIYRQLAGGLTTANVLHSSGNPIGGQSQVIKLRWGERAEGFKFEGAPSGVKFALGENVVQTYMPGPSSRYPMSRMGVREIILDTFARAQAYGRTWDDYRAGRSDLPPRRDLRLEAVAEILTGERRIHVHAYRQDEMLMFIRLMEQLRLPNVTFHHALEAYKVAPELARIDAGVSTFSDWWAYKLETMDGIPQNGALMHAAGVLVSFNSDSTELARRLNTEAAKAVKYGGVPPDEALKLVTLNPALQLGIAERVGSLEPGKDADFVIWSGSPLSTYTQAEQTWIDGRRYFSLAEDALMRGELAAARAALIQKALRARLAALQAGNRNCPVDTQGIAAHSMLQQSRRGFAERTTGDHMISHGVGDTYCRRAYGGTH